MSISRIWSHPSGSLGHKVCRWRKVFVVPLVKMLYLVGSKREGRNRLTLSSWIGAGYDHLHDDHDELMDRCLVEPKSI